MNIRDISIDRKASLRQALSAMDKASLGLLLLLDERGAFERTVTDGDLRRLLLAGTQMDESLSALPRIESIVVTEDRKSVV